jgi:hypothetical protein
MGTCRHGLRRNGDGATGGRVMLAWAVCVLGFAAGALGCVLLATNAQREPLVAARPKRVRYTVPQWLELVQATALDALAVVRRLAAGIAPNEVTSVQVALCNVGERFAALEAAMPARAADGAQHWAAALRVAAHGANAEAARLSGVTVMHTDRRAFLDALRSLRDAPARAERAAARAAATGEVTPSFTVA